MTANPYKIIRVATSKSYDVLIGTGFIDNVGQLIKDDYKPCKIAVITDDVVSKLYLEDVTKSLSECGYDVYSFVFPNGEESKNMHTYSDILNFLAENHFTRTDMMIALGGGVVGDMTGFAAATFLRGIKFIQIPTTLLAQIDSSVGGKTAIDLESGKNLVGAFHQPDFVICDTDTLKSLPKDIFDDGMGEVIKYAVLTKKVFDYLKNDHIDIRELVFLCVEYKRNIVIEDEFEGGNRKLLNLGHTVAHAIENLSGYTISHGKAVRMGIAEMLRISFNHGYITAKQKEEIESVIFKHLNKEYSPYPMDKVAEITLNDKKCSGKNITLVTIHGVGNVQLETINIYKTGEYIK